MIDSCSAFHKLHYDRPTFFHSLLQTSLKLFNVLRKFSALPKSRFCRSNFSISFLMFSSIVFHAERVARNSQYLITPVEAMSRTFIISSRSHFMFAITGM